MSQMIQCSKILSASELREACLPLSAGSDMTDLHFQSDLYGNGRRVLSSELHLGNAEWINQQECRAVPHGDSEYVIKAALHECGSRLNVEEDFIVYSNSLVYSPMKNAAGIIRAAGTAVPPSLKSSTTKRSAVASLDFSLRLMTYDWKFERSSNVYRPGDLMNIEGSVQSTEPTPLRLFLDSCVATWDANTDTVPRYVLIQNHGCLTGSHEVNFTTQFLQRKQNHTLQLQMDASRFHQDSRYTIYITCLLKAGAAAQGVSSVKKACMYTGTRWMSMDGQNEVCQCCDSLCDVRNSDQSKQQDQTSLTGPEAFGRKLVTLGPITVLD
ncbi:zona pellucida sperm-binding protein 3-like [Chanos chanos]|uniref:Zona pellucida sperm-binding protein 3 n=1 Tax=Chanos chanos TaxID=29144 RepID=A0A6J2WX39_CHACN|nr:zona pellucida sperm-binding protein 3-like [Chanos chanos]